MPTTSPPISHIDIGEEGGRAFEISATVPLLSLSLSLYPQDNGKVAERGKFRERREGNEGI